MPTWSSCFGVGLIVWLILPVGVGPALLIRACSARARALALATARAPPKRWARRRVLFCGLSEGMDQVRIGLSRPLWPHCERPEPRYKEDELRTTREVPMCELRGSGVRCHDPPHDEAVDPPVRIFIQFLWSTLAILERKG